MSLNLTFAPRRLARAPGVTTLALLTLAPATGACPARFSIVD
jgi:hypothetical protein